MQPLRLFVQSARGPEVGQTELAAGVFDPIAQDVERAAPFDLRRQPSQKLLSHRGAVMLGEPLPFPRLRGEDEVDDVVRKKAESRIVSLGRAPPVPTREE